MSSFFETKEYKTLKKIVSRMKITTTLKNMVLYTKYLGICLKLAEQKYDNVGYDKLSQSYKWVDSLFDVLPPENYTEDEAREVFSQAGTDSDDILVQLSQKA